MSRSGFSDDYDGDNPSYLLWPSIIRRSIKGKRGQAFLTALRDALEAMPDKRLIAGELEADGAVCAIGSLGKARGVDMKQLDPEDSKAVGKAFNIAPALAREIVFENDDDFSMRPNETPEQRYTRMLDWVRQHIVQPTAAQPQGE